MISFTNKKRFFFLLSLLVYCGTIHAFYKNHSWQPTATLRYRITYALAKDIVDQKKRPDSINILPIELQNFIQLLIDSNLNYGKAFRKAVAHMDIYSDDDIKNLLEAGCNVNIKDGKGQFPLYYAIRYNMHWLFDLLLEHGAHVNMHNEYNETPLYIATYYQRIYFIKKLLQRGAKPNIGNKMNETPLMLAASLGNKKIVSLLLKNGAHVSIKKLMNKRTALFNSVKNNHFAIVTLLLNYGADPNECVIDNYRQLTPIIQIAAQNGSNAIIEALLNAGADSNQKNSKGLTALMKAVQAKQIDTVELLLEYGANKSIEDVFGNTALDYAVEQNNQAIIELLTDKA